MHNLGDADIQGFVNLVSQNKLSRCVCDIDAGRDANISDDLLAAMAKMVHALVSRKITVAVHGPGVMNHVTAHVRQRLTQILTEDFATPAAVIRKRLAASVWPELRSARIRSKLVRRLGKARR